MWWATVIPRCPYGTRIVAKWNHQWSTRSELLTAGQSLEEKNNATSWYTLLQYLFHPSLLLLFKVQKPHKILKISHFVLALQSTNFKTKWEIFSNFVAFSQYLNFYNFWVTMQFIARNFWLCQNWIEPKCAPKITSACQNFEFRPLHTI